VKEKSIFYSKLFSITDFPYSTEIVGMTPIAGVSEQGAEGNI
jgi:hypothetical protein